MSQNPEPTYEYSGQSLSLETKGLFQKNHPHLILQTRRTLLDASFVFGLEYATTRGVLCQPTCDVEGQWWPNAAVGAPDGTTDESSSTPMHGTLCHPQQGVEHLGRDGNSFAVLWYSASITSWLHLQSYLDWRGGNNQIREVYSFFCIFFWW